MKEELPDPVKVDGRWRVSSFKNRSFATMKEARAALWEFRKTSKCLYSGCWEQGHDIGWGKGFRFCDKHESHLWKVLNGPAPVDSLGRKKTR